jgi:hypothetical protein
LNRVNAGVAWRLLLSWGFVAAFAEALDEADGRAGKIEFGAELVFEEVLVG